MQTKGVDVVVLLECAVPVAEVVDKIREITGSTFYYVPARGKEKGIHLLTRLPLSFAQVTEEGPSSRYRFYSLKSPAGIEVLLAIVHFRSKLHTTPASQAQECGVLAHEIKSVERLVGHNNTMLVGDLNMNPFEEGVVSAAGLNATMSRQRASKELRTVQGQRYRFFYNPMWRHFGDGRGAPPGTYHYDGSEHITYFWNIFDQVLVRPSLIQYLDVDTIQIVDSVGSSSLLASDGTPDASIGSDHLPLMFSMRL